MSPPAFVAPNSNTKSESDSQSDEDYHVRSPVPNVALRLLRSDPRQLFPHPITEALLGLGTGSYDGMLLVRRK